MNINYDNVIYVKQMSKNKGILYYKDVKCEAFLGANGLTHNKVEGDKKTPIGEFDIGMAFGMHNKNELYLDESIYYEKLTDSMYWISDSNSVYYNRFINTENTIQNWNCAEHLIDYTIQYEYAIEIKTNPNRVPKCGSAIFLHCSNGKPTMGCISIDSQYMKKIISEINSRTKVLILEKF